MDISSFLLANLLNVVLALLMFIAGAFAAVGVLHIVVKMTPWRMQNVFDEGISGGALVLCVVLFGLSIIIAAAAV